MKTIATLLFLCSTALAATPTQPKVVFIGDSVTAGWSNAFAANPNWVNEGQGNPDDGPGGPGSSFGVLSRFQSDVVSLHPNIVHILIGANDAAAIDDANFALYTTNFLTNLQAILQEAKAANISVILGLEPSNVVFAGNIKQINAVIVATAAADKIPVINYGDALCGCVGSTGGTGVGVGYLTALTSGTPSAAGYALMTQMAEAAIATTGLTVKGGYLQNALLPDANSEDAAGSTTNVNSVAPNAAIQFTPQGIYSNGSQYPLLNSSFAGSSGTWVSSNPLVMYVSQTGLAWSLSPGTAMISFTSPSGVRFSPWGMQVSNPVP